jgi:hypothetical protein
MNITIKPAVVFEQNNVAHPEFIRLPKPGQTDPWTGLSRSSLNTLVWPLSELDGLHQFQGRTSLHSSKLASAPTIGNFGERSGQKASARRFAADYYFGSC